MSHSTKRLAYTIKKYHETQGKYSRLKDTKDTRQLNVMHDLGFSFAIKGIIGMTGEIWIQFTDQKIVITSC